MYRPGLSGSRRGWAVTVCLLLSVAGAQGLDIGGYVVRQTNTVRNYTIPSGTTVNPGGYIVIGRSATKSSFESAWGVTLGTNVIYLNAANSFPRIDGSERFSLHDAGGTNIDAMTPSSIDPVNRSVQRKKASYPAGSSTSWYVTASSAGAPGTGGTGDGTEGLVINEYSDSSSFSYEFVELYYDSAGAATNIPPTLLPIPNQSVTVSNQLQFGVTASPTDGDPITLSVSNAPAGAGFASTNGSGTFTWTNAMPVGVYTTLVYASDNDGASWQAVVISVLDPPQIRFQLSELTFGEDAITQNVAVIISRAASATVDVTAAGTATWGTNNDYTVSPTTLVFTATGPTQLNVTIHIVNDSLTEPIESILLTLTNFVAARSGSPSQFTGYLRDNDAITIMSANLVTGADSKYYDPGTRIMRGLKPDIVGIQEWNITNVSFRNFVDVNFGTNFSYYIEPQATNYFPIPNGIISRWPIKASGEWADPVVSTRDFAWATIDIPGDRDLHVVCIHLYASGTDADRAEEAGYVTNYIATAGWPSNDYVVVCGDLNLNTRTDPAMLVLTNIVSDSRKPADQNGDTDSNSNRTKPFDYVLPGPSLNSNHTTVVVSGSNFVNGIVFDSRLWTNPPAPILTNDSAAVNADHMAIMKAFSLGKTPPALQHIGTRNVFDHDTLQIDVYAAPTDNDTVTLTASNLPAGATFNSTNEFGSFVWTNASPVGVFTTSFYAADADGVEGESVLIRVLVDGQIWINEIHYDNASTDTNEGVEIAGAAGVDLSLYSIYAYNGGDGSVYSSNSLSGTIDDEGCGFGAVWFPIAGLENGPDALALVQNPTGVVQFLSYEGPVVAVEGPAIELSATDIGVAEAGTEVDRSLQLTGTGTNYAQFAWGGPTNATSRGALNSRQVIFPCGEGTNQPPVLSAIGDQSVVQSNLLAFSIAAWDVDADSITLSVSNAPAGSEFGSTNGAGSFTWATPTPVGVYTCTFYAADDDGTDWEIVRITVTTGTEPPVLQTIGNKSVIESHLLTFEVNATDAEGNPISLAISNAPAGSTFTSTNGSGTFTWNNPTPIGVYTSRFYASDINGVDSEIVRFYVMAPTNLPSLAPFGTAYVTAGNTLTFPVTATDADGDTITLSMSNAPAGASFNSSGASGTFTWTNASPVGVYTARFYAVDNDGAVSQPAVLRVLLNGSIWINELHYDNASTDTNEGVEVAGTAGTDLSLFSLIAYNGADGLHYMSNALTGTIDDEGCGYGAVWVPMAGLQNGPDGIVLVELGSNLVQFLSYGATTIIASNGPAAGVTADKLNVAESTTTPVGNSLQLTGIGTSYIQFAWAAATNTASRDSLNAAQWIYPCGGATNQPPFLFPIGNRDVALSNLLTFAVTATEHDGDTVTLTASNLPAGAEFSATGTNGTFTWTNAAPVGVYTSLFYAADKDGADSETVVFRVLETATNPPVLQAIGNRSVTLNNTLQFTVTATDPDGDPITLSVSNAPAGSTFGTTNGAGSFTWTSASPLGSYTSVFWAVGDDGVDSEQIVITVNSAVTASVWINEIHYDNASTDINEGVEVAGPAGTDLSSYYLLGYNGGDGTYYASNALSGTLDDESCGYGAAWFAMTGLQNGGSDAVALVHSGTVIQFLSYEGVITAANGPAAGMTATDLGVTENGFQTNKSLQLRGTGTTYAQFAWAGPTNAMSMGSLNDGQFITGCNGDADSDGLPDTWESSYFNGPTNATSDEDPDVDGFNNYAEYVAGTVPTNGLSFFAMAAGRSNTAGVVQFSSVSDRLYNIYFRTNISAGDWVLFRTNIAGNNSVITISVSNQPAPSYYRSRVTFP